MEDKRNQMLQLFSELDEDKQQFLTDIAGQLYDVQQSMQDKETKEQESHLASGRTSKSLTDF